MDELSLLPVHPTWLPLVTQALAAIDRHYLTELMHDNDWLPGKDNIFNAFTLPLPEVKFILFGESPYPRKESANGFAFWDAAADGLWSEQGLAKKVNRATSLRNIVKMLLVARGDLSKEDLSQAAIAKIAKHNLVQTIDELFQNFLKHKIMLLNACLALTKLGIRQDAKGWRPFRMILLKELALARPDITLILLGNIAKAINALPYAGHFKQFHAEHPYNISFVTNPEVIHFFKPFCLLDRIF